MMVDYNFPAGGHITCKVKQCTTTTGATYTCAGTDRRTVEMGTFSKITFETPVQIRNTGKEFVADLLKTPTVCTVLSGKSRDQLICSAGTIRVKRE